MMSYSPSTARADGSLECQLGLAVIFATMSLTSSPLFASCHTFLCGGDYIIAPVGRRALRAAWLYSPGGDSRCTLSLTRSWLRIGRSGVPLNSPDSSMSIARQRDLKLIHLHPVEGNLER